MSEEILFILKKDEDSFQKEILKILALQFFKEKKLSPGKASELAGMDKNEFTELLGQYNIDIYRYSERELEREVDFISRLSEDVKK